MESIFHTSYIYDYLLFNKYILCLYISLNFNLYAINLGCNLHDLFFKNDYNTNPYETLYVRIPMYLCFININLLESNIF